MAKKPKVAEPNISTQEMQALFTYCYTAFLQRANAEEILEKLEGIEVEPLGEYTSWISQRGLIMLKSYLSEGDDRVQYDCRKRVGGVTSTGTDDQIEAFDMMLEGEITGLDLLAMAKESDDLEWERSLYLKIIAQMITIVEMGASRKYGYKVALRDLEQRIKEARRLF